MAIWLGPWGGSEFRICRWLGPFYHQRRRPYRVSECLSARRWCRDDDPPLKRCRSVLQEEAVVATCGEEFLVWC